MEYTREPIKELRSSLSIPSSTNSYSIAIEYMKKWFLSKFNNGYFKTVHIEGKHVLDDFRTFDNTSALKKSKPSVAITPMIRFEYDRDNLDNYLYGLNNYTRRSRLQSSFFKDMKRNMYLGISLDQLEMEFNFKVRVSTRAQQIDLYKYMNMAFRIGATQEDYLDLDFHIPYPLILQVAKDAGFEIVDNKIVKLLDFVSYMNEHSIIPVLYKYRTVNGKTEFFLRFREVYLHISCLDRLQADDGEREGMLSNNFIIDMNAIIKLPSPKLYSYYSTEEHEIINSVDIVEDVIGLANVKLPKIPDINEKGWQVFITTECLEEDLSKPLCIEFKELIENSDIEKVINHHKDILISPSLFMDFKLYNNGKEIEYEMDWTNFTMTTTNIMEEVLTNIVIYVDLKYVSEQVIQMNEMYKDRFTSVKK